VPITTKVVSSNQVHGKVYLIPLYEIKFVNDLWQVVGFLRVLWVSLTDKKYCHDTQVLFFFLRYKLEGKSLFFVNWGTCCAFILNLVNKKGLPVWKLAYSFSVYMPWTWFELTTLVVIGTDYMCNCKSNYHTITTTTLSKDTIHQGSLWFKISRFNYTCVTSNQQEQATTSYKV
jgi:hypothetical protein